MKLKCTISLIILGISIFIAGIIMYVIVPVIVRQKVSQMLPLKNGTMVYNQWQNPTVPAYLQFWFFSLENPDEILQGSKPVVKQVGPYTYQEHRIKHNITFNENGTVSYLQKRVLIFDRELSVGDENDTLTTINIPLVVIGDKIKDLEDWKKFLVEAFVKSHENYGLFFETSIKNLTWGYEDPVLKWIADFLKKHPWVPIDIDINPMVGLFYGKNNTDDQFYTVDSGNVNLDNFLNIEVWNGSDTLTIWDDKYANMINGTDGSMFAPYLNKSSVLYIYQSDICRAIHTTYSGSGVIKGIQSFDYTAPDSLFANDSVNPANKGFCVDGYCLGTGILNLTKCVPDAPVVMSQPHFYGADPKYINAVIGLNPSNEFTTFLKLEPTTGLPLQLQKKLQINIAMEPVSNFMNMDRIPKLILPMMWINESALIDDDTANMLRNTLVLPVLIGKWGSISVMIFGLLFTIIIIIMNFKSSFHNSKTLNINSDKINVNK